MIAFFIVCFCIIGLILLQEGKGGGIAAMGGSGMDGVMGVRNPLRRWTAYFAVAFLLLALGINGYIAHKGRQIVPDAPEAPALPTPPDAPETTPAPKPDAQPEAAPLPKPDAPPAEGKAEGKVEGKTDKPEAAPAKPEVPALPKPDAAPAEKKAEGKGEEKPKP
jgi:preprotein translocase subunit SecG